MKQSTNRIFQNFFFAAEVISIIGAFLVMAVTLAGSTLGALMPWHVGDVGLVPESGVAMFRNGGIAVGDFRGSVIFSCPPGGSGFPPVLRWYGMPIVLAGVIFSAILFHILRRLFKNVERGQTFSANNVRLIRVLGATIIVFTLASGLAKTWFSHCLADYLNHTEPGMSFTPDDRVVTGPGQSISYRDNHVFLSERANAPLGEQAPRLHNGMNFTSLADMRPAPMTRRPFYLQISWPSLLSGLLVLALGEVFRQGMALKLETDLTI